MKVRGYVAVGLQGYQIVDTLTPELSAGILASGSRLYTFEIEVPHPIPELKVIGESVNEVTREEVQVKADKAVIKPEIIQ